MGRVALAIVLLLSACGGAPAAVPPPTTAPTGVTSPSPTTAALPAGAVRFAAQPKSLVTVKVEEHLAVNTINTDAVLTTDGVTGSFTLLPDATFTPDSTITVDMTKLKSDQDLRDTWIRLFGIESNRFRTATFTPKRAVGLPSPLPASGTWQFTIEGVIGRLMASGTYTVVLRTSPYAVLRAVGPPKAPAAVCYPRPGARSNSVR